MDIVCPLIRSLKDAFNELMDKAPVCPNCLKETSAGSHFCAGCGAPLSTHASTDPVARIRAMGHAFRKATSRPPSQMVLIGMWLIFGPLVIWNLIEIGSVARPWLVIMSSQEPSPSTMLQIDRQTGEIKIVEEPAPRVQVDSAPVALVLLVFLLLLAILAVQVAILWKVTSNYVRGSPKTG